MRLTSDSWMFTTTDNRANNPNYLCTITTDNFQIVASLPQEFTMDFASNYEAAFSQTIGSLSPVQTLAPWARALGVQLTNQALTAQVWQGSADVDFSLPLELQAETNAEVDVLEILSRLYSLVLPDELGGPGGLLTAPGPTLDAEALANSALQSAKDFGSNLASKISDKGAAALSSVLGAPNIKSGSLTDPNGKTASSSDSQGGTNDRTGGQTNPLLGFIKNRISLKIGNHQYFDAVVITGINQTTKVLPVESGTFSRIQVVVNFKTFFLPTQRDIPSMLPNLQVFQDEFTL